MEPLFAVGYKYSEKEERVSNRTLVLLYHRVLHGPITTVQDVRNKIRILAM